MSEKIVKLAVAVAVSILVAGFALPSDPPPDGGEGPRVRLTRGGEVKVADIWVEDGAVLDESAVVIVGTKSADPELAPDPNKLDPNGAIVDLAKKTSRPFTNGHTARICSVTAAGGRIMTVGIARDPTLRVWDYKVNKSLGQVMIEKPATDSDQYAVAAVPKSDRVAIRADPMVILLDPTKPDERVTLRCPPAPKRWLSGPVAVSPDGRRIACSTVLGAEVIVWDIESGKPIASPSLIPKDADPEASFHVNRLHWAANDVLVAARSSGGSEVSDGKQEAAVPAASRGVVQLVFPKAEVKPLKMGQTIYTLACTVDPTGTWLVTGGHSRPVPARADGRGVAGELRVYHLASGELVFREQFPDAIVNWVAFTPSGKRLVCNAGMGVVMWWDVTMK